MKMLTLTLLMLPSSEMRIGSSYSEVATWGVLYKKVFVRISQNSQESTCARVSFFCRYSLY